MYQSTLYWLMLFKANFFKEAKMTLGFLQYKHWNKFEPQKIAIKRPTKCLACTVCVCVHYFISDNSLSCGIGVYSHSDLFGLLFLYVPVCTYFQDFLAVIISMEICLGIYHTWFLCLDSTLCPFLQLVTFCPGYFSHSPPELCPHKTFEVLDLQISSEE